jgi:PAS domain S-box-containing protein
VADDEALRQAERALRASEERLRAVFSQAAVGIAVADLSGRLQEVNRKFGEILGYPPTELYGITWLQITHPEDREPTQRQLNRLLEGAVESYSLEKRYIRKDGRTVWTNTNVTLLKDHTGRAAQLIGFIEDISARRQAEELRGRFAAVVESSQDAVVTQTLDGIVTTWNPAAERMFGYRAEEAIGRAMTLLLAPESPESDHPMLLRLGRGEQVDPYETVIRRKDGEAANISLSVSPIRDANARIVGASIIARDITRQKLAEEAMLEHTGVLELLHSAGSSIASQLNLEAVLQTVTDAATQVTGAKFGAFLLNVLDEQGEAQLLYTLSGIARTEFESLGLVPDTFVSQPTLFGGGVVRSQDITQDPRFGTVVPYSGVPKGELRVRSCLAVPVISRTGEVSGGLLFGHPDANVFTERSERLAVGIAGQAAIAIDNARLYEARQQEILNRERAEAALRDSDQRKDEFLATLAHELRNPLAPIRQAAMIAEAPAASEAQRRWSHSVISRQVQHMSLLLDDLLDISRITRGTLELRRQMTDLTAIVEAALETARPAIDAKQHTFALELPRDPVVLACDPLRIAQVLANLLTNAAKYTDPGGRISLRGFATQQMVTIVVADTGVGIPEEALSRVFTMFSQVRYTRDRSEGGLGIGLALAKGLVELHGGNIQVSSEGRDRGSKFTVQLPRRPITAGVASESPEAAAGEGVKRRVLIADDNRDAAESLAMLLRMDGHEVTLAYDGAEAIAALKTQLPEVALLDIGMPGLDGYEVARRVRRGSLGRAVTLIAVTGWGQDADKAQALAAGFNHHFTKPIEPQQLMELLRSESLGL